MFKNRKLFIIYTFLLMILLQACAASGNGELGLFTTGPGSGSELPMVQNIALSHKFNIGVAGVQGVGIGEFFVPGALAFSPTGSLVVVDFGNKRAERWSLNFETSSGNFQFLDVLAQPVTGVGFASDGTGYYSTWIIGADEIIIRNTNGVATNFSVAGDPQSIVVDADGLVYIGNAATAFSYIQIFNAAGVVQSTISEYAPGEEFGKPRFVKFDSTGQYMFVSDSVDHNVYILKKSGEDWELFQTLGLSVASDAINGFDVPADIAIDSNNILFVADQNNDRVLAYRFNNRLQRWEVIGSHVFGSRGTDDGEFDTPLSVAVYQDDVRNVLVVADTLNKRLSVFTYTVSMAVE